MTALPKMDSRTAAVGQALVDFALYGGFPEEDVSTRRLGIKDFAPALEALAAAKSKLESEIHTINQETASDVQSWVANAKTLEDDINRSRTWANEIVRRAEAPEVSGQTIREVEERVEFLRRETHYNHQVHDALTSIKHVNELLDQAEQARDERRVLDSLHLLAKSWDAMDQISLSKSCRIMRILDMRAFELKSAAHDVLDNVWNSLIRVDTEKGLVAIDETREGEPMTISEVVVGLKSYKEVDKRMEILWHSIDEAIVGPRTNLESKFLPGISTENSTLSLKGQRDQGIQTLFSDLEKIMGYLSKQLPDELVQSLSLVMMPELIPRLINVWLDSAVPASLKEMDGFQEVLDAVRLFCESLQTLNYSSYDELKEWVKSTPRVWLAKCRETALDSVRRKLSQGLGASKEIERVETQTVSRLEQKEFIENGAATSTEYDDDWGAWDDDGGDETPATKSSVDDPVSAMGEDDGADAWGAWGGDDDVVEEKSKPVESTEEDDAAEAWGMWGDEEATASSPQEPEAKAKGPSQKQQTREMTLKETYNISAMPDPVLAFISAILEDGASLVGSQGNPVAAAAAGLFSLPTLILAMFRAVSPYYYALDMGGKMFLYNDATYLSERLSELAVSWKCRDDLAPRAVSMLRLDNDIKTLQSFAARAYASEMSTERTVLRDLLGGAQNLVQQGSTIDDLMPQVEAATTRVRALAATWSAILSRSAWCQAVGSLADTLATKIIADIMDLGGIGQDDAYMIASLIAKVTELDDLFLSPGASTKSEEDIVVPMTGQYAENWLKLKYLSEVLQSNLQDVRYLWCDSDLSLYFTVDEVVELIGLSFADNARMREVVKHIQNNPRPRG